MSQTFPPIIGITLDALNGSEHGYSLYPWLALRKNYTTITIEAGGVPVGLLPFNPKNIDAILNKLDGLIISSGDYNISPELCDAQKIHPNIILNKPRAEFELALVNAAWERNIPILGICGGAQLMAVYLGGTLYPFLPDDYPDALPHEQELPLHLGSHSVLIQPNTLLSSLSPRTNWAVNSSHYQGIKSPGRGIISAVAEDNLIEAIEDPSRSFFVGVQWHPEFGIEYPDRKIFSALIAKAKDYAQQKK